MDYSNIVVPMTMCSRNEVIEKIIMELYKERSNQSIKKERTGLTHMNVQNCVSDRNHFS